MSEEEVLAKKLKGVPCCPKCGYELEEDDEVTITDWSLIRITTSVDENGNLEVVDNEATGEWKKEEEILCPECGKVCYMEEWGVNWEWE